MRSLYYTFLALLAVLIAGCNYGPNSTNKCGPCPMYAQIEPNINFRVVDKTTNQDLFFGAGAPYKISQLVMHHILNGIADSVFLRVDSVNHSFNIFVPPAHRTDTLTMNIANKPQDILLFNTSMIGDCCPRLVLSSVSFDGNVVYVTMDGSKVVVLAK